MPQRLCGRIGALSWPGLVHAQRACSNLQQPSCALHELLQRARRSFVGKQPATKLLLDVGAVAEEDWCVNNGDQLLRYADREIRYRR